VSLETGAHSISLSTESAVKVRRDFSHDKGDEEEEEEIEVENENRCDETSDVVTRPIPARDTPIITTNLIESALVLGAFLRRGFLDFNIIINCSRGKFIVKSINVVFGNQC
jgi:hypothetical protein